MVRRLDDEALRRAWLVSGHLVGRADYRQSQPELVELRQAYLDELERRDPHGIDAWLSADVPTWESVGRSLDLGWSDGGEGHG
jgi:hypothetical protein